jgi:hypothetical protein
MELSDLLHLGLPAYAFAMLFLAQYVITSRKKAMYVSLVVGALVVIADQYVIPTRAPWFVMYSACLVAAVTVISFFAQDIRTAFRKRLSQ